MHYVGHLVCSGYLKDRPSLVLALGPQRAAVSWVSSSMEAERDPGVALEEGEPLGLTELL